MEATQVSINRDMDKNDVAHIYMIEYYSAIKRNKIMPLAETWIDLETATESESQREANTIY